MAARVVYVQWEGRGYGPGSLEKDLAVVREAVGPGPVWTCGFDVGMLFSGADPATLVSEPVIWIDTRHGESDERHGEGLAKAFASDAEGQEEIDSSISMVEADAAPGFWERHDDLDAWIEHAKQEEMI